MMKKKEIEKIIGEAIGEGSMCWRERSKGIFDSENASRIVEETVNKIINIMKSKKDKQICRSRQGEKYRQMWEELYAEYGMCPIRKNDDEGYMSNITPSKSLPNIITYLIILILL